MPNTNKEYLGDGVYAEFDGYFIKLRVNHHENPVAVAIEPEVLESLNNFYKRQLELVKEKKS